MREAKEVSTTLGAGKNMSNINQKKEKKEKQKTKKRQILKVLKMLEVLEVAAEKKEGRFAEDSSGGNFSQIQIQNKPKQ